MDSYWHCSTCGDFDSPCIEISREEYGKAAFYSCPTCGSESIEEGEDCAYCEGSGKDVDEETGEPVECDECGGKGYWEKEVLGSGRFV